MTSHAPRPAGPQTDRGFTLVELMVAMFLLGLLLTGVVAGVTALSGALDHLRAATDITGEARVALERMSRELRQAQRLTAAGPASLTLEGDFDPGHPVTDPLNVGITADERVTYTYDAAAGELVLSTADATQGQPLLAGRVSAFAVEYRSSLWEYDADNDGETTAQEIDQAIGNGNGVLDTAAELAAIDLVHLTVAVTRDGRTQTFVTAANLRNRSYRLGPQPAATPSPSPTP